MSYYTKLFSSNAIFITSLIYFYTKKAHYELYHNVPFISICYSINDREQ
ncbi:hypothetical protein HMPREF9104_00198 [Lentilactobacillus kisonensis F0435]|uniref:Uncharacterized protein n=1 Tax=Lentilactobacillus kisonensis F0435 TaxID=797516 RepID=H1LC85_9LACO|nr:hypothetical protein HMPREF9104_00198 [Lentilactobacillus kisonensis F0435]